MIRAMRHRTFVKSSLAAAFAPVARAQQQKSRPAESHVLIISIDGFRHDYATLHGAPNLESIGREGARAEGLIPVFPSVTFPNHLSIATGLYPEHRGIVDNVFYDPARKATFHYNRAEDSTDGSWYGG